MRWGIGHRKGCRSCFPGRGSDKRKGQRQRRARCVQRTAEGPVGLEARVEAAGNEVGVGRQGPDPHRSLQTLVVS